jgi:hypothetical protein
MWGIGADDGRTSITPLKLICFFPGDRFPYVAQAELELMILRPQPLR